MGVPPQADGPEEDAAVDVSSLTKKVAELQVVDDADSVPILASTHEKADMLMAYSTVPGRLMFFWKWLIVS